jgi:hypothetical protein
MSVTPEQLIAVHEAYEKWVAFRKFDTSFEAFVNEEEMKVKARLYDELCAVNSDGDAEAGNRQGQATAHRAIEHGEPL